MGAPLKPGGAAVMVNKKLQQIAARMRIKPQSAMRYLDPEVLRTYANKTVERLRGLRAAEESLPDTLLSKGDVALLVPVFAMTARIGLLNGDPDVGGRTVGSRDVHPRRHPGRRPRA